MSENQRQPILLPESLGRQLQAFRAHLRRTKVMESLGIACLGVLAGYLTVFLIDRLVDLPSWGRWIAWLLHLRALRRFRSGLSDGFCATGPMHR